MRKGHIMTMGIMMVLASFWMLTESAPIDSETAFPIVVRATQGTQTSFANSGATANLNGEIVATTATLTNIFVGNADITTATIDHLTVTEAHITTSTTQTAYITSGTAQTFYVENLYADITGLETDPIWVLFRDKPVVVVEADGTMEGYDTVQGGVDGASAGAVVLIKPGTYSETVTVQDKSLALKGLGPREAIVITRNQTEVVLAFGEATVNLEPGAGNTIWLENLTVTNTGGGGGQAAAAVIAGDATADGSEYVKVFNCHVESGGRDAFTCWRVDLHLRDSYLKNADGHAHTFWAAYDETVARVEQSYLYTNSSNAVIQLQNNGTYAFAHNYYPDNATIDKVDSATIDRTADFSAQNTIRTSDDPFVAASLKTNSITNVSGNASVSVTDSLSLQIDSDNNGTNTFSVLNGAIGTALSVAETGAATLAGTLTVSSGGMLINGTSEITGGLTIYDNSSNQFVWFNGTTAQMMFSEGAGGPFNINLYGDGTNGYLMTDDVFSANSFRTGTTERISAAGVFTGDGSGLTSLNGSNVASGTVDQARLDANVAMDNEANDYTNQQRITSDHGWVAGVDGTARTVVGMSLTGDYPAGVQRIGFIFPTQDSAVNDEGLIDFGARTSNGSSSGILARIGHRVEATGTANTNLGGAMVFYTRATGSATLPLRMIIDKDGEVGINTATPDDKLDVNGAVDSTGGFKVDGELRIDADGYIVPKTSDDADAPNDSIYYSNDAGKLVYKDAGGTVNALY